MNAPSSPEQARRSPPRGALIAGALAASLMAAAAWYLARPAPEALPESVPRPGVAATATAQAVAAAAVMPAAAAPSTAAPAAAPGGDELAALQFRLDALAMAYNQGDVAGLERAMWQNHAVVRPTGETMYRSDLIGQWTREWSDLGNRELSLVVETLTREGERLTAVWDLSLRGDVTDEKGEVHRMEIHGSQKATYTVAGQDWVLDGPIVYVGFERTIDGDPWPLGQNGR